MKTKQLISIMRADTPRDCRDFWEDLETVPIISVPPKANAVRKYILATVSASVVALFVLIFFLNFNRIKSFFFAAQNTPLEPIVITSDKKDEFDDENEQDGTTSSDNISPLLKETIENSPENALFRTLVSDPSFYEYLNNYEKYGYKYIDFKNGALKDDFEPDAYYAKMRELEYNARMDFFEYITVKFSVENAQKPVESSEYSISEYNFIANLSENQINMLAEKGCILRLALPESNRKNDTVTDRLSLLLDDEQKTEVQIYLKIDTTSSSPTFNGDYYFDRIQKLTYEQLNEEFIYDYTNEFIKDYSLNVAKKECGLFVEPHTQSGDYVDLNYYGCSAWVVAELSRSEIYEISEDERVRVVAPNSFEQPDWRDE